MTILIRQHYSFWIKRINYNSFPASDPKNKLPFVFSCEEADCDEKQDEEFVGFNASGAAIIHDILSSLETWRSGSIRVTVELIGCLAGKVNHRSSSTVLNRSSQILGWNVVLCGGHREIRIWAQEVRLVDPVAANSAHSTRQRRRSQSSSEKPHAVVDYLIVGQCVEFGSRANQENFQQIRERIDFVEVTNSEQPKSLK